MKQFLTSNVRDDVAGKASHSNSDKGKRSLTRSKPAKIKKGMGRRRRKAYTKAPTAYLQRSWRSIAKRIAALSVARRVIHTALVPTSMLRRNFRQLLKFMEEF